MLRWVDSHVEHHRPRLAGRVRAGSQLAGAAGARRASRAARVPWRSGGADVRPAREPAVRIDLSLNARFLPNELALRIARRRIQDADQIVRAESDGDQGVTDLGYAAHPGGARPARPSAGARAGRRCCARRSRSPSRAADRADAGGARRDVPPRLRRDPPAPPARRPASAVPAASARRSARGSPATTTRSPPSRSRR